MVMDITDVRMGSFKTVIYNMGITILVIILLINKKKTICFYFFILFKMLCKQHIEEIIL